MIFALFLTGISNIHRDVWAFPSWWGSYLSPVPTNRDTNPARVRAPSLLQSTTLSLSIQDIEGRSDGVGFSCHWVQDDDGRSHVLESADFPSMGDLIMAAGLGFECFNIHFLALQLPEIWTPKIEPPLATWLRRAFSVSYLNIVQDEDIFRLLRFRWLQLWEDVIWLIRRYMYCPRPPILLQPAPRIHLCFENRRSTKPMCWPCAKSLQPKIAQSSHWCGAVPFQLLLLPII